MILIFATYYFIDWNLQKKNNNVDPLYGDTWKFEQPQASLFIRDLFKFYMLPH